MGRNKTWDEIQSEYPVNPDNAALYDRMLDAERLLDPVRRRRGLPPDAWQTAWEASNPPDPRLDRDDDLLSIARYVSMLGGRLELRAVFDDDEEVLLLREPPERSDP